jgi:ABC-type antimicrobial peptide transport system permease subunit
VPALRAALSALDRDVPVKFSTMEERVGASVADRRFMMTMLSAFAAIALLLAAVGIYSVLSHSVAQRTSEIGIRMALGADARSVVGLMLGTAMRSVGAGVAVGALAGALAVRLLESFLFGVRPIDPIAFAAAAAVLVAVGLVAAYLPARRATRVDPLLALRSQ